MKSEHIAVIKSILEKPTRDLSSLSAAGADISEYIKSGNFFKEVVYRARQIKDRIPEFNDTILLDHISKMENSLKSLETYQEAMTALQGSDFNKLCNDEEAVIPTSQPHLFLNTFSKINPGIAIAYNLEKGQVVVQDGSLKVSPETTIDEFLNKLTGKNTSKLLFRGSQISSNTTMREFVKGKGSESTIQLLGSIQPEIEENIRFQRKSAERKYAAPRPKTVPAPDPAAAAPAPTAAAAPAPILDKDGLKAHLERFLTAPSESSFKELTSNISDSYSSKVITAEEALAFFKQIQATRLDSISSKHKNFFDIQFRNFEQKAVEENKMNLDTTLAEIQKQEKGNDGMITELAFSASETAEKLSELHQKSQDQESRNIAVACLQKAVNPNSYGTNKDHPIIIELIEHLKELWQNIIQSICAEVKMPTLSEASRESTAAPLPVARKQSTGKSIL